MKMSSYAYTLCLGVHSPKRGGGEKKMKRLVVWNMMKVPPWQPLSHFVGKFFWTVAVSTNPYHMIHKMNSWNANKTLTGCKEVTVEIMFDYKQISGTSTDTCMAAAGKALTSDRVKRSMDSKIN